MIHAVQEGSIACYVWHFSLRSLGKYALSPPPGSSVRARVPADRALRAALGLNSGALFSSQKTFGYAASAFDGARVGGAGSSKRGYGIAEEDEPTDALLLRARSVAISVCGALALVGTAGGVVFQYNMQVG